jgi:ribonuclease HI
MDVFEGSPEMWAKLKVGDVLRVEAEGNENVPWKATEAILVSKASKTAVAAEEQQTKSVSFTDEEGDRSKLKRDDATRFLSWHAQGQCFLERIRVEGTSSNRPELGGVVLALQSAALSEDALLLCDNEAVLRVIRKWVGQGGKATLATAPDADILREIICLLKQRVRAGRATFLIKVKSHLGEPINDRADILAEEGRAMSDDDKRWDDRTARMTFEVRKGDTAVR